MKFRKAIESGDLHELKEAYPPMPVGQDPDVEQVIFVLHGIRDTAEWIDELEVSLREVYTRANGFGGPARIKIIKSSDGYFAMLPFLLYASRQRNVRWFMDEYTEVLARYPNAKKIDFVGHSNGTYVLADALQQPRYRTLRVHHVAFAGSVVPRDYYWRSRIHIGQVKAVQKLRRLDRRRGRDLPGASLNSAAPAKLGCRFQRLHAAGREGSGGEVHPREPLVRH